MKKFTELLEKYLQPLSGKISSQKDLSAVAAGLARVTPLTILGSLFFLLANFPIESYKAFLQEINIQSTLMIPYNITFAIISIYTTFFIAYSYAQSEKLDGVSVGVLSMVSFFILTPLTETEGALSYDFTNLGSRGLFVAILVAISVTRLYRFIVRKNWIIRMPDGVPPFVEKSFSSLIPAILISFIMLIVAFVFSRTSFGDVHSLIYTALQRPLLGLGGSFGAFLIAYVLIQILWWFGIHGFNVVGAIMLPIWRRISGYYFCRNLRIDRWHCWALNGQTEYKPVFPYHCSFLLDGIAGICAVCLWYRTECRHCNHRHPYDPRTRSFVYKRHAGYHLRRH